MYLITNKEALCLVLQGFGFLFLQLDLNGQTLGLIQFKFCKLYVGQPVNGSGQVGDLTNSGLL